MSQYYVKKKSMHSFIDWMSYAHDRAELHYSEAVQVLRAGNLSEEDVKSLINERDRAKKFLDEYNEFKNNLNDVELIVLKHIIKYDNKIKGMSQERYGKIKMEIYVKWCRKFMPSDLIFIHELDRHKLSVVLKESRLNAGFSRKSVADFLIISESTMKMYELGERIPKINILYALCELYSLKIDEVIKDSLI